MSAEAELVRIVRNELDLAIRATEVRDAAALSSIRQLDRPDSEFGSSYKAVHALARRDPVLMQRLDSLNESRGKLVGSAIAFLSGCGLFPIDVFLSENESGLPIGDVVTLPPAPPAIAVVAEFDRALIAVGNAIGAFERLVSEAPVVIADTQKFSEAVKSVSCALTQELLWARWNGIQNGTGASQINSDFREKNSRRLGKTEAERKLKWDNISKRARTVIKPFKPDE